VFHASVFRIARALSIRQRFKLQVCLKQPAVWAIFKSSERTLEESHKNEDFIAVEGNTLRTMGTSRHEG
jgi:hypothetical protein